MLVRVINFQFVQAIQPWPCGIVCNLHRAGNCRLFGVSFAMQSFFARVDLAEYRQQQQKVASHLTEHPPPRSIPLPPKRAVGRPKQKRPVEEELATAAAAETLELPTHKRGRYTRWFSSPYINDIMAAYTKHGGSARRTVPHLQKAAPDDRFARLSHSTVASWFEGGNLKPEHQRELDAGRAATSYSGSLPALHSAPEAEQAICDHLLQLRKAGMPLNSHVVRWVMLAVLEKHPAVLEQLTLSQQFISKWVRNNPRLQFRWRCRTTAASKLPDDWESMYAAAATTGVRRRRCSACLLYTSPSPRD